MMTAIERNLALGRLIDPSATPVSNLVGLVLSAYTENGDFDSAYTTKNKDAYNALLDKENFQAVYSRISKEGNDWISVSKLNELKQNLIDAGFICVEADLASLFSSMTFPPHAQPKLPDEKEEQDVDEIPADAKYEIMQNVRLVMAAYKSLYGTVFEALRPKGAFSINPKYGNKHGVILHNTASQLSQNDIKAGKKGSDSQISPSDVAMNRISTIYETIFNGIDLTDVAANDVDYVELGANSGYYFPARAGRFASGTLKSNGIRCKNAEEFEKEQNKWVYTRLEKVYDVYKDKGEQACLNALSIAAQNLATAIVVAEFDASVSNLLVLKICAPSFPNLILSSGNASVAKLQEACKERKLKGVQVRSVSCSINTDKNDNDFPVYTVVVALNDELERNAPMFAYQVWDSIVEAGGSVEDVIGTHNIVFGRKPDGSLKTINMAKLGGDVNHNITVVAGSGSGKGLTTLATVAAAAARKQPLFYLDCKPEMSATLWQYMELAGQPGKVFSYDTFLLGMQGTPKWRNPIPGSDIGKYNHYQFPFDFSEDYDTDELFGGLILVKVLTLMLAFVNFSQKNGNEKERWDYLDYDWKNGLLFVLDELEKNENERLSVIKALVNSKLNGETEGSGKNATQTPRGAYVAKLAKLYNGMIRPLGNADKAILRMSPVSTLSLFQTTKHITGGKSAFEKIFGTATLMGRIDIGGASPIVKDLPPDVSAPISGNNRQWFHIQQSIKMLSSDMMSTPLKPFLVFNTPEDADGYLKHDTTYNTIDDPEYKNKVEVVNRKKLDFIGMLNAYGVNLAHSLAKGYDIIQKFLALAGFEGTVDDYVLSAEPETLITYADLNKRAAENIQKWINGEDFTQKQGGGIQTNNKADWDAEDNNDISDSVNTEVIMTSDGDETGDITDDYEDDLPSDSANERNAEEQPIYSDVKLPVNDTAISTENEGVDAKNCIPDSLSDIVEAKRVYDKASELIKKHGFRADELICADMEWENSYFWKFYVFSDYGVHEHNMKYEVQYGIKQMDTNVINCTIPNGKAIWGKATNYNGDLAVSICQTVLKLHEELINKNASVDSPNSLIPPQRPLQKPPKTAFQQMIEQRVQRTDDGNPYAYTDDGNYLPFNGRYPVSYNIEPGVHGGQRFSSHPIIDTAPASFQYDDNSITPHLTDSRYMVYAKEYNGPTVKRNRLTPAFTSDMTDSQINMTAAMRWQRLLADGAKLGAGGYFDVVSHVSVGENLFVVNDVNIPLTGYNVGDLSVPVAYLADFTALFATYKNLKVLDLDIYARRSFDASYGSPSVPFTKYKRLEHIKFYGRNNQVVADYTRKHAAQELKIPEDRLNARFNTWSAMMAQTNKGSTSAFCKPGNRLIMAGWTKRLAKGVFGTDTKWSAKRRVFGFIGMMLAGAGTVVTGGIQMARAAQLNKR